MARLLPDYDQMGNVSTWSFDTRVSEVHYSLVVARNLFDLAPDPESPTENKVEIKAIQAGDIQAKQYGRMVDRITYIVHIAI